MIKTYAAIRAITASSISGCWVIAPQHLAAEKGYTCLGTHGKGLNAFFVKNELASSILPLRKTRTAFPSRHRDSRNQNGVLSYVSGLERFRLIEDMPIIDVETGKTLLLRDVDRPYFEPWLKAMD